MEKAKVEGHELSLERDLSSKAVLNADTKAFRSAKFRRIKEEQNEQRISILEEQIGGINSKLDILLSRIPQ